MSRIEESSPWGAPWQAHQRFHQKKLVRRHHRVECMSLISFKYRNSLIENKEESPYKPEFVKVFEASGC